MYDELVKKVNASDTSKLVNRTDHNAKIASVTNLAITAAISTV